MSAAGQGMLKMVQTLLAAGADVNAHDDCGLTALADAALVGHLDVVMMLLAAGADVNAAGSRGMTRFSRHRETDT